MSKIFPLFELLLQILLITHLVAICWHGLGKFIIVFQIYILAIYILGVIE